MIDATSLLRLYANRRRAALAVQDPAAAQRAQLRALLRRGARTRFGLAHGFAAMRDVGDYQRAVPLRRYEAFWEEWWKPGFPLLRDQTWPGRVPFFALSSGTTGAATKRIPVSRAMVRSNRRAALDVLSWHLAAHPDSAIFAGRSFMLGGSTALERPAPGVSMGDLSGIAALTIPTWARGRAWPPNDIALLSDWERKVERLVERTPRDEIASLSGTPSWVLPFLDRLADRNPGLPRRLAALFPRLELLVHGGVGFAPYADRFAAWLDGSRASLREVYPASEGFIAVADREPGAGLRLILDNGLFYEFVRPDQLDAANPDRRWIADAELGTEYALVVTSNAGLWSYVLGDTVTLLSRAPPRLRITGRTAWTLSVFGEHLIGAELDEAVSAAAHALGVQVGDYAVGATFPDPGSSRGGHLFLIEYHGDADSIRLAELIDARLCALNADYAAHRQDGVGMLPPHVVRLPRGAFTGWMRSRNRLGGQNKVPRVVTDPALLDSLRRLGEAPTHRR